MTRIALPRLDGHTRLATAFRQRTHPTQQSSIFAAWVILVGIFLPPIEIFLGDTKLTPGRIIVILFFIPALRILSRKDRKWVASDFFCSAMILWMIGSSILNGGYKPFVVAEALEFFSAYLIGRALFFGRPGIQTFMRVFKIVTVILVTFALIDTLTGRVIAFETAANIFPLPVVTSSFRHGFVRATSTFDHPELYGTFCVGATAILLYSERNRIFYSGVGIVGTAFSMSSGPLLGLGIVLLVFFYDLILKKYSWRWKALVVTAASFLLVLFATSNDPIKWIILHLTFSPWNGYWRLGQWNVALTLIGQSPMLGIGFTELVGENIMLFYNQSVDNIWLLEATRYGLPTIILLLLTIFAPFMPFRRESSSSITDRYMDNMRIAFGLAVVSVGIIGLTVHFWNSLWIFFGLCIGIRASFTELEAFRKVANPAVVRTRLRDPGPCLPTEMPRTALGHVQGR